MMYCPSCQHKLMTPKGLGVGVKECRHCGGRFFILATSKPNPDTPTVSTHAMVNLHLKQMVIAILISNMPSSAVKQEVKETERNIREQLMELDPPPTDIELRWLCKTGFKFGRFRK